ncbi:ABC transporter permease [Lysinibacter cavernae]|uniref:Peptide/nickel transport system permease protein n=1 Tax=Lysinibacter cavernae TaxID=1640652 RepID=A0A7X5TS66_9MICO|nr:ABC transporter permease [Lysinibacter cavernae]NIH52585.1 peptide/nickel transport system permease protein [Lysinibacter cavernae]
MKLFLLKRTLIALPVLFGISVIVFALITLQPGDPYASMIDPSAPPEVKEELLQRVGYYDPLAVKYVKWLGRAVTGDFGYSIHYGAPVLQVIGSRIGATLTLAAAALALTLVVSIPAGIYAATHRNLRGDHAITVVSFVLLSVPTFFLGMVLIKIFAADLHLLPASGMRSVGVSTAGLAGVADVASHLILPAVVLASLNIAVFSRYLRGGMSEILGQDFVVLLYAKGLSRNAVIWKHGLKNAAKPLITILTLEIPVLLSGALLTETVFSWPGIGRLNFEAVQNRDYSLLMGIIMMLALITLVANLLADVLYAVVDPRVRVAR